MLDGDTPDPDMLDGDAPDRDAPDRDTPDRETPDAMEADMSYLAGCATRQMASPMALLQGGVPLSLLMDLVLGPQSDDLLRWEQSSQPSTGGELTN